MRTNRLEAFSDGVLAIIITIMVLELREPAGNSFAALWHAAGTGLFSYLLSFVYVGIYWNNHHQLFQLTERVTGGVLWANLSLLVCLALFPYTTQWIDSTDYASTPVVVYGINLLLAAFAYYVLQAVIIGSQGPDSVLRKAVGRDVKGKGSVVGYVVGCVAALLNSGAGPDTLAGRPGTWVALACYVGVAAAWFIPDRRIDRAIRDLAPPLDSD
jgi:uncharacterized membrane protein